MEKNASIIQGFDGKSVVLIHDIKFQGKRKISWDDVEEYLKQYIGTVHEIVEYKDFIYIGTDFADEYSGSKDTARLKGALAKAKANAAQGISELIEIAGCKRFQENFNQKHWKNAKYGWYRYDSRFALPVFGSEGEIEKYNIFHIEILVRHDADGRTYLYDMINIKKETSTPPEQLLYGNKPIS